EGRTGRRARPAEPGPPPGEENGAPPGSEAQTERRRLGPAAVAGIPRPPTSARGGGCRGRPTTGRRRGRGGRRLAVRRRGGPGMIDSDSATADPFGAIADEFVEAVRQGKRPSVEEFAQRYPEHADDIRDILPALVLVEKAKSAGDPPGQQRQANAPDDPAPLRQLGGYQILREIGRGGRGVVYEAQHLPRGRHVAIKALPRHALLDARLLGRFQREARSAARLHHTNIVPVFGVG